MKSGRYRHFKGGEYQVFGVARHSGTYGAIAWIDTHGMVGGYVAVDDYSEIAPCDYLNLVLFEIIPMIADILDKARMLVNR